MIKSKKNSAEYLVCNTREFKCQYTRPTLRTYGKVEMITKGTNRKGPNIDSAQFNCSENGLCYS